LIQTKQFDDVANQSAGSKMPRADWNLISNTEFFVPISMEEQSKIAQAFADLDSLITLHQHKPNKKGHDVLTVMPFKGNQRKPHYLCT